MKKPTKTKAVKAVKYWAAPDSINLYRSRKEARYFSGFHAPTVKPVALLPMDSASVEAMVEQVAEGLCQEDFCDDDATLSKFEPWRAEEYRKQARAALAAIGIKGGAK